MYLKRKIDKILTEWKNSKKRKPVLLRGTRQIGKTESIRHLGKSFDYFIEINFEENKQIISVFQNSLSPDDICENLSAIFDKPITDGKTLLFFDEIQSSIDVLRSLRFFYEKRPNLHVIAAGSLLEFALSEIPSFGVGRIRSIFMYPLSFDEFLQANAKHKLLKMKDNASPENPLIELINEELLSYFQKFLLLGGMPEVIATYIETRDISESRRVIDDLILSLQDDFAKYKKRLSSALLKEVFDSVVMQTGGKFTYTKASSANIKSIKQALNLLILSGLVIPIKHTAANGLPLGAEINLKKQKMIIFDTGIFLRLLDFDIAEFISSKEFNIINKGNVAEMFVGLELLKYQSPYQRTNLYYWHREAKSSNAEIDYLIVKNRKICPIEVKAGTKGSMQSMFLFLKSKNIMEGIRISSENFGNYDNISIYPLHSIKNILEQTLE